MFKTIDGRTIACHKRPSLTSDAQRVVGYVRVSTEEQADSGAGLAAQRSAIAAEAARRGWQLVAIYEDAAASGKSLSGRTGLQAALIAVEGGEAGALVVAKLDRLSRSLLDFAGLMDRSKRRGWSLVALDLGVDTTTPQGEVMASVLAAFAQFERRLIGQRTKDALAERRAAGVRLGRPSTLPTTTVATVKRLRAEGLTYQGIADELRTSGTPSGQGGRWTATTVRRIALRAA